MALPPFSFVLNDLPLFPAHFFKTNIRKRQFKKKRNSELNLQIPVLFSVAAFSFVLNDLSLFPAHFSLKWTNQRGPFLNQPIRGPQIGQLNFSCEIEIRKPERENSKLRICKFLSCFQFWKPLRLVLSCSDLAVVCILKFLMHFEWRCIILSSRQRWALSSLRLSGFQDLCSSNSFSYYIMKQNRNTKTQGSRTFTSLVILWVPTLRAMLEKNFSPWTRESLDALPPWIRLSLCFKACQSLSVWTRETRTLSMLFTLTPRVFSWEVRNELGLDETATYFSFHLDLCSAVYFIF